MRVEPPEPKVAPVRFYVETPGFVRHLESSALVRVGATMASSVPRVLNATDVPELVDELASAERSLPIVVVTHPASESKLLPRAAPHLARYLFGLANVVELSHGATHALTERVGRAMSCFDGGLRIYWPGWSGTDAPGRHKLFWKKYVYASKQYNRDDPYQLMRLHMMSRLARAAAARFAYPATMLEVLEASRRSAQLTEPAEQQSLASLENMRREVARLSGELKFFQEYAEERDKEIASLKSRLEELEADDVEDDADWSIETVEEAIERARAEFRGTLLFSSDPIENTNVGDGYWFKVLRCLHELCLHERRGLGMSKDAALSDIVAAELGIPCRYKKADTGVYATHPASRARIHLRERLHVKQGAPAETESVYWETLGDSRETYQYFVGRVGRHA
jgi:hypothetical protein